MKTIRHNVLIPKGLEAQMTEAAKGTHYKEFMFSILVIVDEEALLYAEHLYHIKVAVTNGDSKIALTVYNELNREVLSSYFNKGPDSDKWVKAITQTIGDLLLEFNRSKYCEE